MGGKGEGILQIDVLYRAKRKLIDIELIAIQIGQFRVHLAEVHTRCASILVACKDQQILRT